MKKLLIIPMILTNFLTNGQNMVPNPSFEDTLLCPDFSNQLMRATSWGAFRGSPDYFNSCADSIGYFVDVPENYAGYQSPLSGNAYAGFVSYYVFGEIPRECSGVQLMQTLIVGHSYYVSFFVCRAVSNLFFLNQASNKLGAKFSTVPYTLGNPVAIDNIAQVYSDSVITDTINWTEINGFFIADSAYKFLIIGNFFSDSATQHISFDSSATCAYYFLDEVSVVDSTAVGIPNISVELTPEIYTDLNDELIINLAGIESVAIIDMTGRKCANYQRPVSNKISLNNLRNGIYLVQVRTSQNFFIKKILKN